VREPETLDGQQVYYETRRASSLRSEKRTRGPSPLQFWQWLSLIVYPEQAFFCAARDLGEPRGSVAFVATQ